jgi:hypothetical protein
MVEIPKKVMAQLEQAQVELTQSFETEGPPITAEVTATEVAAPTIGAAGSGQAQHVLMDHYFTSSTRRLWAHSEGAWRYQNVENIEEQGIAQVAYAANRVDVWWDSNNRLTLIRCWKNY